MPGIGWLAKYSVVLFCTMFCSTFSVIILLLLFLFSALIRLICLQSLNEYLFSPALYFSVYFFSFFHWRLKQRKSSKKSTKVLPCLALLFKTHTFFKQYFVFLFSSLFTTFIPFFREIEHGTKTTKKLSHNNYKPIERRTTTHRNVFTACLHYLF